MQRNISVERSGSTIDLPKRKSRVCVDITNVVPGKGGTGGGILTYAINLITYLDGIADQADIEFFCLKNAAFINFPSVRSIKVIDIDVNNSNLLSRIFWLQVRLPLFCLKNRIDLLHRSIAELPLLGVCRYISTLHDFMFDFYLTKGDLRQYLTPMEKMKFRFLNMLNTLAIKNSDSIIVPSNAVKREVEEKFPKHGTKVSVTWLASGQAPVSAHKRHSHDFLRIGTVAGFYPHKGHLKVLQLASQFLKSGFSKFRFYFRGSHVYKNYVEEVKSAIKELQLEDFVVFEPYEPNTTLQAIYQKYDAVILLPEYEGFGLPVLEAQAHSAAVVCSDIPVLKEVLENSAMYINTDRLESEVDELIQKLTNSHELAQLVLAGEQNVNRFSWLKTGEQTLEVYRATLN